LVRRLATTRIALPPLRERLTDLPLLCDHFLRIYATKYRRPRRTLPNAVAAGLTTRPWPGNVRELEAVMARYALGGDAAAAS
jgi:DNA-binding NtrC family response regulator